MSEKRSLLKGQGFLVISVSAVIVAGLVITNLVRGAISPDRAMPPGIMAIYIGLALAVVVPGMAIALIVVRRIIGDRIEVAFREPGGRWRHGRLTVMAGHLSFQPYL